MPRPISGSTKTVSYTHLDVYKRQVHNREFEEGVLRIEFYDEDSSAKAAALLQKYRYIVYEI